MGREIRHIYIYEENIQKQELLAHISVQSSGVPAGENVCDGGPLDRAVPAEGEARLVVDVLRVSSIRTIVTVIDGDLDLRSFRMRLPSITGVIITLLLMLCCLS